MTRIAAIADDFTGATDLATTLRNKGFSVVVTVENALIDPAELSGTDAVIVALKTRTAPRDEAVGHVLTAVRALRALAPSQYYVKYCSTFDSTRDGNIGPMLDAVLDELGERRAVVVPAFPDNGRTVYQGHLFVGRQLLSDSSMRSHPLTPMVESRVANILAPQTDRPVGEIPVQTVWAGPNALTRELDMHPDGYIVVDAITNADLVTIAEAVAGFNVVSGGSGLAVGMPGHGEHPSAWRPPPAGRRLVLCGSASAMTRAQIARSATQHPVRRLPSRR